MIKKNLDIIIVGFVVLSIIMYDVTFDLFEELLHVIFEILHNMFEWVELGVEHIVEYVFHVLHIGDAVAFLFITERHGSQVVTFYILMTMIGFGLYRLSNFMRRSYEFFKRQALMSWIRRKTQFQLYWYSLSSLHKAAMLATALSVAFVAAMFVI